MAYKVTDVHPELVFEKIGEPRGIRNISTTRDYFLTVIGDKCGGSFVDTAFLSWLRAKLGPTNYGILAGGLAREDIGPHTVMNESLEDVLKQFQELKEAYDGTAQGATNTIQLRGELGNLSIPDENIMSGEITFTKCVAIKIMFPKLMNNQ